MDKAIIKNNTRLHVGRRYDSMEGIGGVESGTETESDSGNKTDELLPTNIDPDYYLNINHFSPPTPVRMTYQKLFRGSLICYL